VRLLCECLRVEEDIESGDVDLIDEFDGHPSVHKLVSNGYQVLTF
jgi:hypothetical protein